jgi:hypothetical protein
MEISAMNCGIKKWWNCFLAQYLGERVRNIIGLRILVSLHEAKQERNCLFGQRPHVPQGLRAAEL